MEESWKVWLSKDILEVPLSPKCTERKCNQAFPEQIERKCKQAYKSSPIGMCLLEDKNDVKYVEVWPTVLNFYPSHIGATPKGIVSQDSHQQILKVAESAGRFGYW